ncbi:unnamed protein product [Polarella glacialis]|uniref:SAM-dependent MTase RsmB/NOP-type domain-containing protein n=2 Tax=Polarella glacialis TaxID=89957 RepID=A0A813G0E4_POLGL|nr:unnamed protein product [Polarella glacialis]
MGRQGAKRRGTRQKGSLEPSGLVEVEESTAPRPEAKRARQGGSHLEEEAVKLGGSLQNPDALGCMPWNRWKEGAAVDPKQEHAELAEWKEKSFTNPLFEAYYQAQGIMAADELPTLLATLKRPLPVTFRVNPAHHAGASILRRLQKETLGALHRARPQLRAWRWRGQKLEFLAREVQHLPENCVVWGLGLDRAGFNVGRKQHPEMKELFEAVQHGMSVGAVVRQEVVSMLPVSVLRPLPGQRALDMFAAPGSKTAQLLEAIRPDSEAAGGLVVANDAGAEERIPLLRRALGARPVSEQAGLVITCAKGEQLPLMCVRRRNTAF